MWDVPLLLAAVTGARRGEVLAVAWSEVDLESGRLRIVRSLQASPGEPRFLPPKTKQGRRGIMLPPFAVERLRQHRADQLERRLALGPAWHDFNLVCERGDGAPIRPHALSQAFKRLGAKSGLHPDTRLHDLRHALAKQLARSGTVHPKIASSWLGHASVAFTLDTYTEDWSDGAQQAADAIAGAFGQIWMRVSVEPHAGQGGAFSITR